MAAPKWMNAAKVFAVTALALSLTAITYLHQVRVDKDPHRNAMSEYAVGPHAWVLSVAFAAFAAMMTVVALVLWREHGLAAKWTLFAALGFWTVVATPLGTHGFWGKVTDGFHGAGAYLGAFGVVVAAWHLKRAKGLAVMLSLAFAASFALPPFGVGFGQVQRAFFIVNIVWALSALQIRVPSAWLQAVRSTTTSKTQDASFVSPGISGDSTLFRDRRPES